MRLAGSLETSACVLTQRPVKIGIPTILMVDQSYHRLSLHIPEFQHCILWNLVVCHRFLEQVDLLKQKLADLRNSLWGETLIRSLIVGSSMLSQHLRSYQDRHRLVTVHTDGNFIVLPHLETRLPA